jgi:hypothetical protein
MLGDNWSQVEYSKDGTSRYSVMMEKDARNEQGQVEQSGTEETAYTQEVIRHTKNLLQDKTSYDKYSEENMKFWADPRSDAITMLQGGKMKVWTKCIYKVHMS